MTQTAKNILLGVLGLSALLATIGGSIALARAANKATPTSSPTTSETSSSSSGSTESGASSSSIPEASSSSESAETSSASSSSISAEQQDGPYITTDRTSMTITVAYDDEEMPYGYFTPEIHNPDPEDGSSAAKYLAVCCPTDSTFLDWLDFYMIDGDREVSAVTRATTVPGVITWSGYPLKVVMKQKPPIAGGYQLRLRVYSPYYDSSIVRSFVDVDLRTVR